MKTIRQLVTILVILACAIPAAASRLETVKVESESMHKQIDVSVVLPDSYGARPLPVVYLLHGYGDNNLLGYLSYTNVRQYADMFDVVLAIPDGGTNWYFDSPVDPTIRYETFVSSELVKYIDKNYLTDARRERRAVTGLSMGGHGALYLAIRHQDVFGAAGSMSGGVDFRPFPEKWDIKLRLGDQKTHKENWDKNTVMAQLPLLKDGALQLIIDCGTEDFFFDVNVKLHEALTKQGIHHEFTSRPGKHSWVYWRRSLRDHMYFFNDYFRN